MASLPQVGLEAVIAGLPGFESGAKTINAAFDSIEKKAYKLTYFPFTHGESILHQRQAWREMQQADLAL